MYYNTNLHEELAPARHAPLSDESVDRFLLLLRLLDLDEARYGVHRLLRVRTIFVFYLEITPHFRNGAPL